VSRHPPGHGPESVCQSLQRPPHAGRTKLSHHLNPRAIGTGADNAIGPGMKEIEDRCAIVCAQFTQGLPHSEGIDIDRLPGRFRTAFIHSGSDQANILILIRFRQDKLCFHGLNPLFYPPNECCKQILAYAIREYPQLARPFFPVSRFPFSALSALKYPFHPQKRASKPVFTPKQGHKHLSFKCLPWPVPAPRPHVRPFFNFFHCFEFTLHQLQKWVA